MQSLKKSASGLPIRSMGLNRAVSRQVMILELIAVESLALCQLSLSSLAVGVWVQSAFSLPLSVYCDIGSSPSSSCAFSVPSLRAVDIRSFGLRFALLLLPRALQRRRVASPSPRTRRSILVVGSLASCAFVLFVLLESGIQARGEYPQMCEAMEGAQRAAVTHFAAQLLFQPALKL